MTNDEVRSEVASLIRHSISAIPSTFVICSPPSDPTIVWGTEVETARLTEYVSRANRGSRVLISPAHVLVKAVGRALALHPKFNRRILGRRLYRFRDVNVLMPFQRPGGKGAGLCLFKNVDTSSLSEIAAELWKRSRETAGDGSPHGLAERTFRLLLRWLNLRLRRHGFTGRSVEIDWSAKPELKVEAQFASNVNPSNPELRSERIREIVLDGWKSFLRHSIAGPTRIPDVDFGSTALRISKIGASNSLLTATFASPGTRITNSSQQSLQYEVKGPSTTWGGPYTLSPGESHTFHVPYHMIYRQRARSDYVRYTLPAGFHAEYGTSAEGNTPRLLQAE